MQLSFPWHLVMFLCYNVYIILTVWFCWQNSHQCVIHGYRTYIFVSMYICVYGDRSGDDAFILKKTQRKCCLRFRLWLTGCCCCVHASKVIHSSFRWQTEPWKMLTVYTGLIRSTWWRKSPGLESTSLNTGRRSVSAWPVSVAC